ncbi:MAG TPA: hypothetical protein PLP14_03380, partial [Chitinophagaceae bacterium]|nr:hypothetical protein [Chitinophagaceae bacterium]
MPNNRMNKTIAGYHLLMILSAVDYRFHINEEHIIREYLVHEFPFHVNLDREMEVISNLDHDDWETHFQKCLEDFQDDSTEEERTNFLRFALHLAKADDVIT